MQAHICSAGLLALAAVTLSAQPLAYTISTIAGSAAYDFAEGRQATSFLGAGTYKPVADQQGNFYFTTGDKVVKVKPDGTMSTYAGTGVTGSSGDKGPAAAAQLNFPFYLTFDPAGRLVIFDNGNSRIRRVEQDGTISTIVGTGQAPPFGTVDGDGGLATAARINATFGVYDSAGNLYFLDGGSNFRKVDTSGRISTVAKGVPGNFFDMTSDGTNIYVADFGNDQIKRLNTSSGALTTVAGSTQGNFGDGMAALSAKFNQIWNIAADAGGNLHLTDSANNRIRMIRNNPPSAVVSSGTGVVSTTAGTGANGFGADGAPALSSPLSGAIRVSVDANGNIYFVDSNTSRIRRYKVGGAVQTVAGVSYTDPLGDGGPATAAGLAVPRALSRDALGNLLVDQIGRIRKITTDGTISAFAGQFFGGSTADHIPASTATIDPIFSMVQDSGGNAYIIDGGVVRKLGTDGTIATILGFPGAKQDEGPAGAVGLNSPQALAIDAQDNLYIADSGTVHMMTPAGTVTHLVGSGAATQVSLATGNARNATLNFAAGLAVDPAGNLYISDSYNHRILQVTPAGQFSTVAGTFAKSGYSGDGGPAAQALLNQPRSLSIDAWGNLYFIDAVNHYIRKITPGGIISTIAGNGITGLAPDGTLGTAGPVDVQFGGATVLADPAGNILFTQPTTKRVSQLTPNKLQSSGVQHAALMAPGPVTSNLLVNIQGTELIPPAVTSSIGVLFDGQPAGVVSTNNGQIVAVVPTLTPSQTTTRLQVSINGALTNSLTLNAVAAIPGILGILNADGSQNSESAPASNGDMVTILETGDGNADPSTIAVQIGGAQANIVGISATTPGILQITVQLPDGTADGSPVVVMVGSASSQSGVAIGVQSARIHRR